MTRFKGAFQGIIPVLPHGYLRKLSIKTEERDIEFHVGFKKIEEQTKGIKKGDMVKIEYTSYDQFTITKL